tara:strand:+ start:2588 stop:2956 length:369 start_codon:yes stop_codon:yes gene_type:complete
MKIELLYLLLKKWLSVEEVELLSEILSHIVALIKQLREIEEAKGEDKRRAVVEAIGDWIDEELDDPVYLPGALGWEEMNEERRDRLLIGLVEITLWVLEVREDRPKKRQFKLIQRVRSVFKD